MSTSVQILRKRPHSSSDIDNCSAARWQIRKIMAQWLKEAFDLTHVITLTTHDSALSPSIMRRRLKQWDARVNRAMYGPKWWAHKDDLIWYFAFIEKPTANPHWHLLLRHGGRWSGDPLAERLQFGVAAAQAWQFLTPSGTVDVRTIDQKGYRTIEEYVAKELAYAIQYEHFVTPDEFRSR